MEGHEASFRFLIEGGKIQIQADLPDQVLTLELDEATVTGAFLRRAQGWSKAIGGRFRVSQPFRAVPPK